MLLQKTLSGRRGAATWTSSSPSSASPWISPTSGGRRPLVGIACMMGYIPLKGPVSCDVSFLGLIFKSEFLTPLLIPKMQCCGSGSVWSVKDTGPDPSIIKQTDVNVPSVIGNKKKAKNPDVLKKNLLASWRSLTKISGSGSAEVWIRWSGSGSVLNFQHC
jgi:hypothetical protein